MRRKRLVLADLRGQSCNHEAKAPGRQIRACWKEGFPTNGAVYQAASQSCGLLNPRNAHQSLEECMSVREIERELALAWVKD